MIQTGHNRPSRRSSRSRSVTTGKVLTELARTAIVASVFAWIAHRSGDLDASHAVVLALIMWAGFPLVLLTGSVIWEKVHPATAALHGGDWLIKLLLIAVILGLLH
jgi:hypothetical protein